MTKEEEATKAFEIMRPYLSQVNSTPELLSLLYDIDMLPEQTVTVPGAVRLVAFCCLWELMADAEREKGEASVLRGDR